MFGILRYILATIVVIGHLWPTLSPGMGSYAVFGFYILSGYLMTLVITEVYGFTSSGIFRFLLNRALRIYPPYLIVLLLSLIIILVFPVVPQQFISVFQLPNRTIDWLKNIFIFGLKLGSVPMLVAVAWSLYVELFYYLVMALGLVRKRAWVILWFIFSLLCTVYMIVKGYDFDTRYFSIVAGSLPFSTGALIYFMKDKINASSAIFINSLVLLSLINIILTRNLGWNYMNMTGLYVSYFLSVGIISYCVTINLSRLPQFLIKLDTFLGDLSYPIYLCHWPIAISISCMFFSGNLQRTSLLFFISIGVINLVSYIIHYFIESRVNLIRNKLKTKF